MARHRPRRQHRGRDDRNRRAARLRRTLQNHRPHPRRGQERQPRRLRHDPEALRHDRVGIINTRPQALINQGVEVFTHIPLQSIDNA